MYSISHIGVESLLYQSIFL